MNLARQGSAVMLKQRQRGLHNKIVHRVYKHGFDLLITIATVDSLLEPDRYSWNIVLVSETSVGVREADLMGWALTKPTKLLTITWR